MTTISGGRLARRSVRGSLALLLALLLAALPTPGAAISPSTDTSARAYVVSLRPSAATGIRGPASLLSGTDAVSTVRAVDRAVRDLESDVDFRATHRFAHALTGFAAPLTPAQVHRLERDPRVAAVSRDRAVAPADEDFVPKNVIRVGAGPSVVPGPVDADVAVIDTGLSKQRTDELTIGQGHNCVPDGPVVDGEPTVDPDDWMDKYSYGHGTHVAGIIGAMDNDVGIVGVAPGARIWPVRVFPANRGGRTSWIVCAIDWIVQQVEPDPDDPGETRPIIEVVNMSLARGGRDRTCAQESGHASPNLDHVAICNAVESGITFVVAAGNSRRNIETDGGDVLPAAFDEVITVSGLSDTDGLPGGLGAGCSGADDGFGNYSNFGAEIDLIAPGSCVLSLTKDPLAPGPSGAPIGTRTLTGTSMATPAVAGAAAVHLDDHPELSGVPGAWLQVRQALRAAATLDWRWETDPDGDPDRLLAVSRSLDGPAGIDLWARPSQVIVGTADAQATYAIDLSRAGHFAGTVDLSVAESELPAGVTASFDDDPLVGLGGIETRLNLDVAPDASEGVHTITVDADAAPDLHAEATVSLMIDHQPPDLDGPHVRFHEGGTLLTFSAPLDLDWSATDALSGLDRFALRYHVDGGAWLNVPLSDPLADAATRPVQFGRSYEFDVRATDEAGNLGSAVTPGLTPVLRQSDGLGVSVGAGWTVVASDHASGGSFQRSKVSGSRMTFDFTGRSVAWVTQIGPRQGRVRVFLDGVDQGRVDLGSPTRAHRRLVFVAGWDTSAPHRLEIVVRGGASAKAVSVDAFLVLTE